MSRIRRLLFSLLIVVMAGVAVRLGFWQLSRLHERRAANAAMLAGRDLPSLDLASALRSQTPVEGRRATVRGHFLKHQRLLRGRVQQEQPGLQVVTAFAVDSSDHSIWVLRGFVAAPDAATPPATITAPLEGSVALSGVLLSIPVTQDAGQPLEVGHDTTWRRMDQAAFMAALPGALPEYLHLEGDAAGPGQLPMVPLPTLDEGPHLSYVIQWFGIATAILVFGWVMVWRKRPQSALP